MLRSLCTACRLRCGIYVVCIAFPGFLGATVTSTQSFKVFFRINADTAEIGNLHASRKNGRQRMLRHAMAFGCWICAFMLCGYFRYASHDYSMFSVQSYSLKCMSLHTYKNISVTREFACGLLGLAQRFPNYVPGNTGVPWKVNKCSAKNYEN